MNNLEKFGCDIFFNSKKKTNADYIQSDSHSQQISTLFPIKKTQDSLDLKYDSKNLFLEHKNIPCQMTLEKYNSDLLLNPSLKTEKALISSSDGNLSPQNFLETLSSYSGSNSSITSYQKVSSTMSEEEVNEPLSKENGASQNSHSKINLSPKKSKCKVRRKAWQPHEDDQLLKLVEEYGTKWSKIASMMKGRTGKQIRDRYLNNLNPEILEKEWTKEEDNLILFLYYNWGKKWSKIASALPGRSEGQVKNRFHWGLKRKVLNSQFANYNPVQIVTHKNMMGIENFEGDNFIPKININPLLVSKVNPDVYFDYPVVPDLEVKNQETQIPTKAQLRDPDDFISYNNNNENERVDLAKLLERFSHN